MLRLFLIVFLFSLVITSALGINMQKRKTILIDLDGVLNTYDGNYSENYIPEVKKGAKEFIKKLNIDYDLILFTTRNSLEASRWLMENKIDKYFKNVTNVKIPAYLYLDDRAIGFSGDYKKTLEQIEDFKAHWKNP